MSLHIPPQFSKRVMAMVNAHGWLTGQWNPQLLRLFSAWIKAEGGTAQFNPLNCTLWLPGATAYNTFTSGGKTYHVWNYLHAIDGCSSTAMTLANGSYGQILGAIQAGVDQTHPAEEIVKAAWDQFKLWGTNPQVILDVLETA